MNRWFMVCEIFIVVEMVSNEKGVFCEVIFEVLE